MFLIATALLAATPATLPAVINTARAGDTIKLAPGMYNAVKIVRKTWTPAITIDAAGATLPNVTLNQSSGVTWRSGTIVGYDTPDFADGYGFLALNSSNVAIGGVQISEVRVGINIQSSSNVRITGNTMTKMSADGIDIALSRDIVVDGNKCRDFRSYPGAHPDCIQLWSRPTADPTADVTITNNDAQGDMQGIVLQDHTRIGINDGGFDRITIRGNTTLTTYGGGITMYNCRACSVRNNNVNSLPNYKSRAQLAIIGGSVAACGNIVPMVPYQATPPCPR